MNIFGSFISFKGCDTGFGLSLAHRLQAYGFYVYACCLSEDSQGAQELSKVSKNMKVLMLDVTKYDNVQNVAKQVEADLLDKGKKNLVGINLWSVIIWGLCS